MEQRPAQASNIRIAAKQATVWAAMCDPQILSRCIEGTPELSEMNPPDSCVLHLRQGAGVDADRATVAVQLSDKAGETQLSYRVADAADQDMATNFFTAFANLQQEDGVVETPEQTSGGYQPSQQGIIWAIMFGVLILAVVLTL